VVLWEDPGNRGAVVWSIKPVSAKPVASSPPPSLTGARVHSADSRMQTPENKVVIIQEGVNVTLAGSYKYNGKWVTFACKGPLSGLDLRMQCNWD
jgi:hypothetical protein